MVTKKAAEKEKGKSFSLELFMPELREGGAVEQQNGVKLSNGTSSTKNVLLDSGTGTGKTTQMINGLVDLLASGVKPEKMLFMTYSREASDEVRERLAKAMEEKRVPGVRASDVEVKTFGSYAYGLMQDQAVEAKELMSKEQARIFILEGLRQNNPRRYSDDYLADQVSNVENAIAYLKGFGLLPTNIDFGIAKKELDDTCKVRGYDEVRTTNNLTFFEAFMRTFEHYERRKKEEGLLDYNDRLMLMKERLDRGEGPYKKYDYVFVDGIQDMNLLESYIVDKSGKLKRLVRDEKKGIFEFRGGGIENAWSTTSMEGVIRGGSGNVNKRNLPEISAYAGELFLRNVSDRKAYEADFAGLKNERTGRKGVVTLTVSEEQEEAAAAIVKDIHDRGEEVAVLGRTNRQLAVVAEKLDELGIKYSGTIRGSSGGRAKKDVLDYLTGLMYNEPEVVLRALFSPYSGVTWATAYEIKEKYKKGDMTFDDAKRAAKPFFEVKDEFTRDRIKEVFDTRILPVAVGISKEHFLIARAMYRSLEAYADKSEVGDRNSLFDYLRMSSEGYSPIGEGNGVLLATVHKAKSKWFDNVVYMPKYFGREAGFIDNAKYAIMKSAAGIDIVDRTKDEPIKIDFVAVTRAQNELYVVANHKQHPRFYIEGLVTEMPPKKIDIKPELQKARSALAAVSRESDEKDGYREIIFDHFKKNEHISFTRVTSLDKPYDYLLNYIIELQEKSSVMATGRDVHDMAEKFFRKTLAEASLTDGQRKFLDNIKEVYTTIAERMKGKQTDAEYSFDLDISEVFGKFKSGTVFTGKIDAVFEAETPKGKRYILVDYKTDKDGTWFDEHLKQVAVYKKAFAVKKRLNEDDIDVVVAYIGKNTGASSFGVEIHSSVPGKEMMTISKRVLDGKLEELKGDVARMIEYRADPEQFVKALLQTPKSQQDSRFKIIERTLMGERGVVIRDLERA